MSYQTHWCGFPHLKQQSGCSTQKHSSDFPEMVDTDHRLVHHQIQLPVYYSPVPDTNSVCGHLGHQWVVLDAYTYLPSILIPRELQWFLEFCCCLRASLNFAALSEVPRSIVWDTQVHHHYQIGIDFVFIHCLNSTT